MQTTLPSDFKFEWKIPDIDSELLEFIRRSDKVRRDFEVRLMQGIADQEDQMYIYGKPPDTYALPNEPGTPPVTIETGPSVRLDQARPVPGNTQFDYARMTTSGGTKTHVSRKPAGIRGNTHSV